MGKQTDEKVANLIREKYGEFTPENMKKYFLEEFSVASRGRKIDEDDYSAILSQIEILAKAQGLTLEAVDYLGFGQRYSTLGIGDAVLKIGNTTEKVYENPFRLSPVYKEDLKPDLGLYVSQRARCGKVPESAVQEMYNRIRNAGGLWLDLKDENLGYVDKMFDFSSIYPTQESPNEIQDKEFDDYDGNLFIVDYEDVIFLTPGLREKMLNGEAYNVNSIPRELLLGNQDLDTIYFEGFIKNSNKLLECEQKYQRENGNRKAVKKCAATIRENKRQIMQQRYRTEQIYAHDRNPGEIGPRFSAREIGIQVMQKTNFPRLQSIVSTITSKMREGRENKNSKQNQVSTVNIDEINVNAINLEDPYTTSKAVGGGTVDLEDPYRTI